MKFFGKKSQELPIFGSKTPIFGQKSNFFVVFISKFQTEHESSESSAKKTSLVRKIMKTSNRFVTKNVFVSSPLNSMSRT